MPIIKELIVKKVIGIVGPQGGYIGEGSVGLDGLLVGIAQES